MSDGDEDIKYNLEESHGSSHNTKVRARLCNDIYEALKDTQTLTKHDVNVGLGTYFKNLRSKVQVPEDKRQGKIASNRNRNRIIAVSCWKTCTCFQTLSTYVTMGLFIPFYL